MFVVGIRLLCSSKPDNLKDYYKSWATREFQSPKLSSDIADLIADYGQLAAVRKNELETPTIYSSINYREADTITARWSALAAKAESLGKQVPSATYNTFFQVLQHPVVASANLRVMYTAAKRNQDLASQASGGANAYAKLVETAFDKDWELRDKYHKINGGKWKYVLRNPIVFSRLTLYQPHDGPNARRILLLAAAACGHDAARMEG